MKPIPLLVAILLSVAPLRAQPTCTIEVDVNNPGADYQDIQSAIDAASDGDVICVQPGTYVISQEILITRSITLRAVRGPEVTILRPATIPLLGQFGIHTMKPAPAEPSPVIEIIGFQIREFYTGLRLEAAGANSLIANNVITRNERFGLNYNISSAGVDASTRILNNTLAYNKNGQIVFAAGGGTFPEEFSYNNLTIGETGCGEPFGYNYWRAFSTSGSCSGNPQVSEALAFRFTSVSSPLIDAGYPNSHFNDPDGTRGDVGAYGGPYSQGFFRDVTGGPTITDVVVSPPQVGPGEPIVIRATVRTD